MPARIESDVAEMIENFKNAYFSDNIVKLILFGSYATKKHQPDSDMDIAVVVRRKPQKTALADYYMAADSRRCETDLTICTEKQLYSGKGVFAEIQREGVVLYEKL
jgi:predicted nucleotidyltransferase